MINKINSVGNVKVFSNLNFKSEEKIVSKPIIEKKYDPSPLTNYSIASMNLKSKMKVTPLIPTIYLPEAVDTIKGERVYKSNGDLYSIIDENDKTRTVYIPVEGRNDMFESIITIDKETGNVIREQYNEIEGREHKAIFIHQFSPETGKEVAFTRYDEGELDYAAKTIYNKDGSKTEICYDYDNKEYSIYETSKDGKKHESVYMSDDMKFITIDSSYKNNTRKVHSRAEYYNGALLNSETTTTSIASNMMGLDYLQDEDLKPEKVMTKEELQTLADSVEGEKTYFSNGKVESIKGKVSDLDVEVRFNPSGEVTDIISEKGEIKVDTYSISETKIVDKDYKITNTNYKNGGRSVTLEKDGKFKEVNFSEKGIITSYYQGEIEENGERDYELSLHYDNNGMLVNAYSC